MTQGPLNKHALRRFFAGITEHAFHSRLGIADPPLVDYVSLLLARFTRSDELFGIRSPTGEPLDQVADMLNEARQRQGPARRKAHRHIGDFTLFWTGVYPEGVSRLRGAGRKDALIDYPDQGKRAYFVASQIPSDREDARGSVLERLSHQYELCVQGLALVRRELEGRDAFPGPPSPLWTN